MSAVILAGGKSSRMGFDKQTLKINGEYICNYIAKLLEPTFEEVILVTNKKFLYEESSINLVEDKIKNKGVLAGIYTGLYYSSYPYVYIIGCDMPLLNIDYIKYLKRKAYENTEIKAIVTRYKNYMEPLNAIYHRDNIKIIETLLINNKKAIRELTNRINTYYVPEQKAKAFSPNWEMFTNLNTLEDIKIMEEFLKYPKGELTLLKPKVTLTNTI